MVDVYQNWVLYNVGKAIKNGTEYLFDWTMLNEYNQLVLYYDTVKWELRTSIINKWVDVPASASIDTYPWYIDQIDTWVPVEEFDIAESMSTWVILGTVDADYQNDYYPYWTWAWLCCSVWWYVFMVWAWWTSSDISGTTRRYVHNLWIYYKQIWSATWSLCKTSWLKDVRDWNFGGLTLSWVYVESDSSIVIKMINQCTSTTYYFKWVIWSNSISSTSETVGEDLANYKIYNCETASKSRWSYADEFQFRITSSVL